MKGWLVMSSTLALALHRAAVEALGPVLLNQWLVDDDIVAGRLVDLFPMHEVSASGSDSGAWLLCVSRDCVPWRVRAVVDFFKEKLGV